MPRADQLETIVVGQDTKESVAEKIGQPTLDSLRTANAWYYVESRFRHLAFFAPEEIERQVVRIGFDASNRVSNIESFGIEDGQVIRLSARETKTGDTDLGFLAAIFRNLGNVDPASLIN